MSEVWYDTRLGEALIGDDAIIPRLQESTPGDVVPLQDLILDEDFPFNSHDFLRSLALSGRAGTFWPSAIRPSNCSNIPNTPG